MQASLLRETFVPESCDVLSASLFFLKQVAIFGSGPRGIQAEDASLQSSKTSIWLPRLRAVDVHDLRSKVAMERQKIEFVLPLREPTLPPAPHPTSKLR